MFGSIIEMDCGERRRSDQIHITDLRAAARNNRGALGSEAALLFALAWRTSMSEQWRSASCAMMNIVRCTEALYTPPANQRNASRRVRRCQVSLARVVRNLCP